MKRFLLLFLVAVMPTVSSAQGLMRLATIVAGSNSKSQNGTVKRFEVAPFEFEIIGDGSVALVDYFFSKDPVPFSTELIIPEVVTFQGNSYKVTAIETDSKINAGRSTTKGSCFKSNKQITSIILPPSVTSIGHSSFANMKYLNSIYIPESVVQIGVNAFFNCNISSFEILSPKIKIEYGAFSYSGVKSIKINSDYVSIDEEAFMVTGINEIQVKARAISSVILKKGKYYPTPLITIIDEPQQTTAPTNTYIASTPEMPLPIEETPKNISDVDKNIPQTSLKNDKTFAVIIANEKYATESTVDFALNDGKVFKVGSKF